MGPGRGFQYYKNRHGSINPLEDTDKLYVEYSHWWI